jgi:hypothetical protein
MNASYSSDDLVHGHAECSAEITRVSSSDPRSCSHDSATGDTLAGPGDGGSLERHPRPRTGSPPGWVGHADCATWGFLGGRPRFRF